VNKVGREWGGARQLTASSRASRAKKNAKHAAKAQSNSRAFMELLAGLGPSNLVAYDFSSAGDFVAVAW